MARAEDIADRERGLAGHAAQFAAAVDRLRNRHNCTHLVWNRVQGAHDCEECGHNLPRFIFRCRQCHLQACRRCRDNRL